MRHRSLALVGGTVLDGTGAAGRRATVLVEDGRIMDLLPPTSSLSPDIQILDCSHQIVSPGFIDTHSHADNVPFLDEDDTSKIEQGVTAEVTGNCGFSLAPIDALQRDTAQALLNRIFPPLDLTWSHMSELFAAGTARGLVTHHVPLVGHNSLRIAAMGAEGRAAEPDEVRRMVSLLESSLEAGAFGLSSGLIYPPGLFAEPTELEALTRVLGAERIYATHMRNESTRVFDSIAESLHAVGDRCRLHVSHVKIADRQKWGRMTDLLTALDEARERGQQVWQDAYPYTAGSTMLTATLPPWFQDGGGPAVLARLESPEARRRAQHDMETDLGYENVVAGAGWENIVVSSTGSHRYEGMSLARIADHLDSTPFDALSQVLREENLQATMVLHYLNEEDVRTALSHPLTAIGSDGLPPGTGGRPHPRTFGTFPRVLGHYARDEGLMELPEAVRRMTSLPADIFGLRDRGRIRRGAVADLVTFDPETVIDRSTYDEPANRPRGIGYVLQDGHVVVDEGAWLGDRCGRRLQPA